MVGKVVTQLAGTIPAGAVDEESAPHAAPRRSPHCPGVVTIIDTHSVGEGQVSESETSSTRLQPAARVTLTGPFG